MARRVLLVSLLALSACGGGGGGGGGGASPPPVDSVPTISNLRYDPSSALEMPSGVVTLNGTIDFVDLGGDISALHLSTSAGDNLTVPVPQPAASRGTLIGAFSVSSEKIGHFTFQVWLEDSAGHTSNHLSGTFDVVLNDSASTWREIPLSLNANFLLGAAWNGTTYVAVGQSGIVITSTDAITWKQQQTPVDVPLLRLSSVAWSGSTWAAVGDGGTSGRAAILTSPDGVAWTARYQTDICNDPHIQPPICTPRQTLSKIVWDGAQFVTVGSEADVGSRPTALIMTSPDGMTWTQRASGSIPVGSDEGLGMASIASSGSVLVAAGQAADGTAAVWTSIDAVNWIQQSLPLSGQRVLRDVVWGPKGFVAVGWGGSPATAVSLDGFSWQANQDVGFLPAMNAVAAGPTQYLALSSTSIQTSTTGETWLNTQTMRTCSNAVLWDGGRWVSFGAGVCLSP
jgi:hypothetical protein